VGGDYALIAHRFALLPLAACDWDWTLRGAAEQPEDAANLALNLLQDVVDEHNYKQLGFDSPAQAQQAVSGKQPLDVYIVRLDKLREWNGQEGGAEALVLQSKTSEVVYPVLVDTQVKSTVSIFRDKTGYRPAMFGNAQLAGTLARYRQSDADFIVRAPAFATYFIGRKTGDQVTLTPIEADARLPDFQPGKPVASIQIRGSFGCWRKVRINAKPAGYRTQLDRKMKSRARVARVPAPDRDLYPGSQRVWGQESPPISPPPPVGSTWTETQSTVGGVDRHTCDDRQLPLI
jgi:hypothetical protein